MNYAEGTKTPEEKFLAKFEQADKYVDDHASILDEEVHDFGKLESDLTQAFENMPEALRKKHKGKYEDLKEDLSHFDDIHNGIAL
ncbi:hypothetical protein ACFLZB_00335 [Nanoarchaeota archaeon]